MNKREKDKLKADLEAYCNNVIERKGESGKDWAFGAIQFAKYAGLITFNESLELDGKTWDKKGRDESSEVKRPPAWQS